MKKAIWLISPPASGKTTVLLDIFAQLPGENWIFLSPLRALAEEFYLRVKDIIPTQMYWRKKTDLKGVKGLLILTPEQVDENIEDFLKDSLVIVDEIHLWPHWGDSFRPVMWEAYYTVATLSSSVIHLTATANNELLNWIHLSNCHYDEILLLNFGNNSMKYHPDKMIYYPKSFKNRAMKTIKRKILQNKEGCLLIFCAYRKEVFEWKKWCDQNGIFALSCVGGEAKIFQQELLLVPRIPDVIISTTVLSHGVNLPEIAGVYFTHEVGDQDFWLQMVTRGGRKGQKFEVLTFDKQFIKPSVFAMLKEEFKNFFHSILDLEGPWNLKASSPQKSLTKNVT